MHRYRITIVVQAAVAALGLVLSPCILSAQRAAMTGIIRDAAGVAQLGVLVQVTAADSSLISRAFTDTHGRYLIPNLIPGRYQVQASAALFSPALHSGVRLQAGTRTVVNLTLTTLFDTATWLPAERRRADEPADDWAWTLRSAASRPILRMVEDGQLVLVSSSANENRTPALRGTTGMTSGDGGFGNGGLHQVLTFDRLQEDGSAVVLRVDTGSGRPQSGIAPATGLSAGVERQLGPGTTTRAVASFQSHPELLGAGASGLQSMELNTAQRTQIADILSVEVGGSIAATHALGYGFSAHPFLRLSLEPVAGWDLGYRMATSRTVQGYADLNTVQPETPIAAVTNGHLAFETGRHQEVSIGRKLGRGQVQIALYEDRLRNVAIAGGGSLSSGEIRSLQPTGGVVDGLTDSFRLLTAGYTSNGVNVLVSQPLGQSLWAVAECSTGTALATSGEPATGLSDIVRTLHPKSGNTATVGLKGALPRSGTRVRAVYRWQPSGLLTPIDAYREFSDQAFFSFHVRQPLRWEGVLPAGLETSVDVTNLLAQGYQPFLSVDGRILYLAQSPRTLQAGLSINF